MFMPAAPSAPTPPPAQAWATLLTPQGGEGPKSYFSEDPMLQPAASPTVLPYANPDEEAPGSFEPQVNQYAYTKPPVDDKVVSFFVMLCIYAMLMLVTIPIWNAILLLSSVPYTHLMGRSMPLAFIICICVIVVCLGTVVKLFFRWSRPEAHTGQMLITVGSTVLTILGIAFMLAGNSLAQASQVSQREVLHNCQFGEHTAELYSEGKILLAMRSRPDCITQPTVQHCVGYNETYAGRVLLTMEHEFRCSRFCTQGEPITLFSQANYTSSCQMMVARSLKNFVTDVGNQMYAEGIMLVLACTAAILLKLMGYCVPKRWMATVGKDILGQLQAGVYKKEAVRKLRISRSSLDGDGYGSLEETVKRSRYVSKGILN